MTNRPSYPTPEEVRAITAGAQRLRARTLARLAGNALAALWGLVARIDPRAQPNR